MYKAHWSDEKFVHITSKRFVDRADDELLPLEEYPGI